MLKKVTLIAAVVVLATGMVGFAFAANTLPEDNSANHVTANKEMKTGRMAKKLKESDDFPTYNAYPNTKTLTVDVGEGIKMCLSSNSKVAKVSTKGAVTARKIGTAKIDVYRLSGKDKHDTFYIRVAKKQKLNAEEPVYTAAYGDKPFELNVRTNARGARINGYRSSDENVVSVTENGKVRIKDIGEAKITVHASATRTHHEAELNIPIVVERKTPKVKVLNGDLSVTMLESGKKLEMKSDSKGAYVYKSSDKSIVKVKKDGTIVPVAEGTATILITQKENGRFAKASVETSVEVLPALTSGGIQGAIDWAVSIANDDSFAYGTGRTAHRYGCYFCGTNIKKKGKKYEKTYCCNPFVFAAYAHGSGNSSLLRVCQKGSGGGLSADTWTRYGVFTNVGATRNVSFSQLQPGDVVIKKGRHAWMYLGGNELVEAGSEGWGASSISIKSDAPSRYRSYQKTEGCVIRYTGN